LTAGKDPRNVNARLRLTLDWPNATRWLITEQKKIWKSADAFVR